MKNHYIAWWNLENLLDVEGAEERPDYLLANYRRSAWDFLL
jgi:hypothetical protein